jgi:hypothetical protein
MPPKRKHAKKHKRKSHHGKGYDNNKMKGEGFFSDMWDAVKSVPTAITQIIPGISGAAANTNEIVDRGRQLVDIGKKGYELGTQVLPVVAPLIGGRRRHRGRGPMHSNLANPFYPSDAAVSVGISKVVM